MMKTVFTLYSKIDFHHLSKKRSKSPEFDSGLFDMCYASVTTT